MGWRTFVGMTSPVMIGLCQIRPIRRSIGKIALLFFLSTLFMLSYHYWPETNWATIDERESAEKSLKKWKYGIGFCDRCNAYNYNRIISPRALCSTFDNGKSPKLLIIVSTIHRNRKSRCYIRKTWGSYTLNNRGKVRLLFLFGKEPSRNLTDERLLRDEAATFGDILQDDFNSTYRRGGEIQLIMGYEWAVRHCSNVKHVLKVSDDTYVNIPRILNLINSNNLSNCVWGRCWNLPHPIRNITHRWYVSPSQWPPELYPKYCVGAYIGTTIEVIRQVLLISPYIAWSSGNDDVLLGMCLEKLGIPVKHIPGFYVWNKSNVCKAKGPIYVLHTHGQPPEILSHFWSMREKCLE